MRKIFWSSVKQIRSMVLWPSFSSSPFGLFIFFSRAPILVLPYLPSPHGFQPIFWAFIMGLNQLVKCPNSSGHQSSFMSVIRMEALTPQCLDPLRLNLAHLWLPRPWPFDATTVSRRLLNLSHKTDQSPTGSQSFPFNRGLAIPTCSIMGQGQSWLTLFNHRLKFVANSIPFGSSNNN